jgi:hypothetical protein
MSDDGYFGLCRICHKHDGYLNAGRTHVFFCKEHELSWGGSVNILSTWQFETEKQQRKAWQEIGLDRFQRVEPYFPPRTITEREFSPPAGAFHRESSFEAYQAEDPIAAALADGRETFEF